ncbi:MAG: VTT domain-containing protein [Candidatus Nealsonbacteria bacterium]|nr:VTT domain-containing protein [Candidatus Nealsonbacteria bacterium]
MRKELCLQITIFLLVIGLSVLIFLFREKIVGLEEYGYLGAFLISMLTNATLVIPAPGWAVIMGLAAIFNPWLIGLLAGFGAALGQTTGYFFGYSGRAVAKNSAKYQRMINWMRRRGALVIFFFALIPNPFVDIVGAAAGILKFPFLKFIFFCALGTVPKYIFFALLGGWGLEFFF